MNDPLALKRPPCRKHYFVAGVCWNCSLTKSAHDRARKETNHGRKKVSR